MCDKKAPKNFQLECRQGDHQKRRQVGKLTSSLLRSYVQGGWQPQPCCQSHLRERHIHLELFFLTQFCGRLVPKKSHAVRTCKQVQLRFSKDVTENVIKGGFQYINQFLEHLFDAFQILVYATSFELITFTKV